MYTMKLQYLLCVLIPVMYCSFATTRLVVQPLSTLFILMEATHHCSLTSNQKFAICFLAKLKKNRHHVHSYLTELPDLAATED